MSFEFIGQYVILGQFVCKVVSSTLGDPNYISLQTMNGKYIKHSHMVIKETNYIDKELFKYDSSFLLLKEGDYCTLYCSNERLKHLCIAYENRLILGTKKEGVRITQFKLVDGNDEILLNCLSKLSLLEERLNTLVSQFELHHPITNLPKAFGALRMFQDEGVELLKIFDEICRKHNLKYWIDYGTLLGAVRHKGYIPWDDDLDVCMMSDDFYKFQEIIDGELIGLDIEYTHNFHPYIYKLRQTSLKSNNAWLDIFPFYYQKENVLPEYYAQDFAQTRVKRKEILSDVNEVRKLALNFNDKYDAKQKTSRIFRGFQSADHPLCDVRDYNEVFPLVELEFEGLSLFAPNQYLEKLKKQYGNFWQYPHSFRSHKEWN